MKWILLVILMVALSGCYTETGVQEVSSDYPMFQYNPYYGSVYYGGWYDYNMGFAWYPYLYYSYPPMVGYRYNYGYYHHPHHYNPVPPVRYEVRPRPGFRTNPLPLPGKNPSGTSGRDTYRPNPRVSSPATYQMPSGVREMQRSNPVNSGMQKTSSSNSSGRGSGNQRK